MSTNGRNRKAAGTPEGGRFAATPRAESSEILDGPPEDEQIDVIDLDHDQLWEVVEDPDPCVRAGAVRSMNLDGSQIRVLMDPERQPLSVRKAVTRILHCAVAEAASRDPHPLIKLAALDGWDLPVEDRDRLLADPDVRRAADLFFRAGAA